MHRKVQLRDDPKNIHKIFIPQKIFSFLKTPKSILKFKILNRQKSLSLRMHENIRVPTSLQGGGGDRQTDLRLRISLLKSEISNIFFCLAPLIKVHANCY